MPEAEKLKKVNALGSAISVWGKLIIGLFIFIISIGTAWYQIETNASDNIRQDEQFKQIINNQTTQFTQILNTVTKEFNIISQRGDKRYKRLLQLTKDVEAYNQNQDEKILDLYKEVYLIKGHLKK